MKKFLKVTGVVIGIAAIGYAVWSAVDNYIKEKENEEDCLDWEDFDDEDDYFADDDFEDEEEDIVIPIHTPDEIKEDIETNDTTSD